MNKNIIHNFTEGSVSKHLLTFSVPFMLSNALQVFYSIVDMAVVGNVVGKGGLSAVSTASQVVTFMTMLCLGFSTGGQVYISQLIGANKRDKLNSTIGTLATLTAAIGVFMSLVGVAFCKPILRLLSTPEKAFDMASGYLLICAAGIIFTYGYNLVAAILRGMGDSKNPMIFIAIASAVNLTLDILFVKYLNFGVSGAAAATVIGQAVSFITALIFLIKKKAQLGFDFKLRSFVPHRQTMGALCSLSIPFALRSAAVNISMMFVMGLVNNIGVEESAVFGVGIKVDDIINKVSQGLTFGVSAVVGQNIAAGELSRTKRTVYYGWLYSAVMYAVFTVVYLTRPEELFRIFTKDPGVIELAPVFVSALVWSFPAMALMRGTNGFVQGIGNSVMSLVFALIDGFVLRIGLSYLLGIKLGFGIYGLFLGYGLACYGGAIPGMIYFFFGKWKKRKLKVQA